MLGPSSIGSPAMSRELCWKGNSSRLKPASVRDAGIAGSVPCYTIMLAHGALDCNSELPHIYCQCLRQLDFRCHTPI